MCNFQNTDNTNCTNCGVLLGDYIHLEPYYLDYSGQEELRHASSRFNLVHAIEEASDIVIEEEYDSD